MATPPGASTRSDFHIRRASLLDRWVGARVDFIGRRVLVQITVVAAAFPLFVLASFYIFVCLARSKLGHWPVFNDPYPDVLPAFSEWHGIAYSVLAFPVASLAAAVLSLLGRWRYSDFPMWKLLGFNIVSASLLLIFSQADPGSFWNWFWD